MTSGRHSSESVGSLKIVTDSNYNFSHSNKGLRGHYGDSRRFSFYCAYGFGIPALFTALMLLIDHTSLVADSYRPSIGNGSCWIKQNMKVEVIYVYLPMILIITSNVGFFLTTAFKIFCVQKETSYVRKVESCRHSSSNVDTERFASASKLKT